MDADGRFTIGSDEFVALIGPRSTAALGRPWHEIAADARPRSRRPGRARDRDARHLERRHRSPGRSTAARERLAVELSGLPVFDRDRDFPRLSRLRRLPRRLARASTPIGATRAGSRRAEPPAPRASPSSGTGTSCRSAGRSRRRAGPDARSSARRSTSCRAGSPTRINDADAPARRQRTATQPATPDAAPAPDAGTRRPSPHVASRATTQPATRDSARPFLDRLPVGVLIYRLDHLLYANRAFLRMDRLRRPRRAGARPAGSTASWSSPAPIALDRAAAGKTFTIASRARRQRCRPRARLLHGAVGRRDRAEARAGAAPAGATTAPRPPSSRCAPREGRDARARSDPRHRDRRRRRARPRRRASCRLNRSAEALFGYEAHELAGRPFTDLFAPESERAALDYLDGLPRTASPACSTTGAR